MGAKRAAPEIRFWRFVEKSVGCWLWTGAVDRNGYGRFFDGKKSVFAHRFSFEMHICALGDGSALHKCDNPRCVNPSHLFRGTQADNVSDMISKGRQRSDETRARGSQIANSLIDEETARQVYDLILSAPRSATGRIRRGYLAEISNITAVSYHIVASISCGSWAHVQQRESIT